MQKNNRPSARSTVFVLTPLVLLMLGLSQPVTAGALPDPINLTWTGAVSTDILDVNNWVGANAAFPSPVFLIGNNLIFPETAQRNAEYAPPRAALIQGEDECDEMAQSADFNFRNFTLAVNSIQFNNFRIPGGAEGTFTIRATPQTRCQFPPENSALGYNDFAAIATQDFNITGGGRLEVIDSNVPNSPIAGPGVEFTSEASLLVNGPVNMSAGSLVMRHTTSNIDRASARITILDRVDLQGNKVPGSEGNFNWSGGVISFEAGELNGDRRASLEIEGDINYSGGAIGQATGLLSLVRTSGTPQQITSTTGVTPLPALQVTQLPFTLAAGQRLQLNGAFREAGGSLTSSLVVANSFTMEGQASKSGAPDLDMVGGISFGSPSNVPSAPNFSVGTNRTIDGDEGGFVFLGGDIVMSAGSEMDIRGYFIANDASLNFLSTLNVTGTGAVMKMAGWNVIANRNTPDFVATFGPNNTLELSGGSPTIFQQLGAGAVTWPNEVVWGDSRIAAVLPTLELDPAARTLKTLRIQDTTIPLTHNDGTVIDVNSLIIEENGKLEVYDGSTLQVNNTDISNAGTMFPFNISRTSTGRILAPSSSVFATNAGGAPVASYAVGDTAFIQVTDSDKNLNGPSPDALIGILDGSETGLVLFEVFNQGSLADSELMDQTSGVNSVVETGNQTFVFRNPGMPIVDRGANPMGTFNDGQLFATSGDTLRMTYRDPNGDQIIVDTPIANMGELLKVPDLVIESMDLQVTNQSVKVNATIRNDGDAPNNDTKFGLFRDRVSAPQNGDVPDFTFDVARIAPFLAADSLSLVTQNNDTLRIIPLAVDNLEGGATFKDTSANDIILEPQTAPLQISNVSNGATFRQAGTANAEILPGVIDPVTIQAFESGTTVNVNDDGTTAATSFSGTNTEGSNSLQFDIEFGGTPGASPTATVVQNVALSRTYTNGEISSGEVFFDISVRGDTGFVQSGTNLKVRINDSDGDVVNLVANNFGGSVNPNFITQSLAFSSISGSGDGNLGAIQSIDVEVEDATGRTMGGSLLFDRLRLREMSTAPSVRLETAAGGLLFEVKGNNGSANTFTNPTGAVPIGPVRVIVDAGDINASLTLGETDLTVQDTNGDTFVITLPTITNLATQTQDYFWVSGKGATFDGTMAQTSPDFTTLRRGDVSTRAPQVILESGSSQNIISFIGSTSPTSNNVVDAGALGGATPIRVQVDSGDNGLRLSLPQTDIAVTDENGRMRVITLPSINLATDNQTFFWISENGSSYTGASGQTEPVFDVLRRGDIIRQSEIEIAATAGTTYYFAVDGLKFGPDLFDVRSGDITFTWGTTPQFTRGSSLRGPTPPANDELVDFETISGASGSVTGSNENATKQPGEPNHANNAGGRSVWFGWTAPSTGTFFFDTYTSEFDTLLAAYTAPEPTLDVCATFNAYPFGDNLQGWGFIDSENTTNELTGETNNSFGAITYSVAAPPDFAPDIVIDDIDITIVDQTITQAVVTLRNGGPQDASGFLVNLFLDRDTPPVASSAGAAASQFFSGGGSGLPAGQTGTITFGPFGQSPGEFNMYAFADPGLIIPEVPSGGEDNNASEANPYTIESPPDARPDLRIDNDTFTVTNNGSPVDTSQSGQILQSGSITFEFDVVNQGLGPAPAASTASIFYNTVEVPTSGAGADVNLAIPALAANGRVTLSHTVTTLEPQIYTTRFLVDSGMQVDETDELNNTSGFGPYQITAGGDLPNLRINTILTNLEDGRLDVGVFVSNDGVTPTDASKLGIYLDASGPPNSANLADVILPIPPLGVQPGTRGDDGNNASTVLLQVRFNNPPEGEFELYAFADVENEILESDGSDNVFGPSAWGNPDLADAVRSDLVMNSLLAVPTGSDSATFIGAVENKGAMFAEDSVMYFYHDRLRRPQVGDESAEILIDDVEGDAAITRWSLIGTGGANGTAKSISVRSDVAQGTFNAFDGVQYLVLSVDWAAPNGDQVTGRLDMPGASINLAEAAVLNVGTFSFNSNLAAPTVDQQVRITARDADGTQSMSEFFNVGSTPPDNGLQFDMLRGVISGGDGTFDVTQVASIDFTLLRNGQNIGGYDLVLDAIQSNSTVAVPFLSNILPPEQQPQEIASSEIIFWQRSGLAPGNYNAWALMDGPGSVDESDEDNNATGFFGPTSGVGTPYSIGDTSNGSDLTITNVTASSSGTSVNRSVTILNQGNAAAAAGVVGIYTDRETPPVQRVGGGALTAPDATAAYGALAPGASTTVNFPAITQNGGFYRPWAFVDSGDTTSERNEGNNVRALNTGGTEFDSELYEVVGGTELPDLVVTLDPRPFADFSDVVYNVVVTNEGDEPSISTDVGLYYFSQDQPPPPGTVADVFLPIESLNPGESTSVEYRFQNLDFGTYRTWAYVDPFNVIMESDEGNNASEEPFSYILPGTGFFKPDLPDLDVTEVVITDNEARFIVNITVTNNNIFPPKTSEPSILKFTWEGTGDVSGTTGFKNSPVPAIAPGGFFTVTGINTGQIPAPGTYILRAIIDPGNEIEEHNENNNTSGVTDCGPACTRRGEIEVPDVLGPNPNPGPDVALQSFNVDAKGTGALYQIGISNPGITNATGDFRIGVFFDLPQAPTADDIPDAVIRVRDGLAPLESRFVTLQRSDIPAGTYTAWVRVDVRDAVMETFEDNNVNATGVVYGSVAPVGGSTLTVTSDPVFFLGVEMKEPSSVPGFPDTLIDQNGLADGNTDFSRFLAPADTQVRLRAKNDPYLGRNFSAWIDTDSGTTISTNVEVIVPIVGDTNIEAKYDGEAIMNFPDEFIVR